MNKFEELGATFASFAIHRPVTVSLFFATVLMFGVVASQFLPLEKWPGIDIPEITVNIPYSGATPTEIEETITRPLEETLSTMSGIKRLRSESNENGAQVRLEFDWDENINAKSIEAREKVDAIRQTLPDDVERVQIFQFNTNDLPIFQIRVSSELDLSNAYDLLERNLKIPLERVDGVSRVELYGVLKKQISIRINGDKLSALHVEVNQLAQTLQQANFSMTAGSFYDLDKKITVNPLGELRSKEAIENLVIQKGIRLSDVADVAYEIPRRTEGRHLDQTFAVGFNIFRQADSNLVQVSERVLKVIDAANSNPAFSGINLFILEDEATGVKQSLADLLSAGLLGAALSFLTLYLFLRQTTNTILIVLSVPFSIFITLGCMYMLDYSLNILSLMGLMLAVGMLVDNAVVVTESINQEKQHISDPVKATKVGVGKVSLAVIAGTATTAIVFLPNIVGKKIDITVFLEHVAIAICISLFASLLIAQTLIPLLSTKIKPSKSSSQEKKPSWLKNKYKGSLQWMLRHQGWTSFILVALLAVTVALPMQNVSSDEEDDGNNNKVWLNYNIKGSYSLDEVEKTVEKVEQYLYANKEKLHIKQVYTYYNPGSATSGITLEDNLPIKQSQIKKWIIEGMPNLARAEPSFRFERGNGGGIELTLLGESSETLTQIGNRLVPIIANIEGLTDVRTDIDGQKLELQIIFDRQKLFRFGLNSQDASAIVATALRGSNLRTMRNDVTGETDVRLLFEESLQTSIDDLKNLSLLRQGTQNITLDMVAELKINPRLAQIRRYYRQSAMAIRANKDGEASLDELKERITNVMQYVDLPVGYSWTLEGSFRRQREAEAVMQTNILLAVCMIYIVMAALFESLLLPTSVITSLIFAFGGVFWSFYLTGTSMSIMGMIGMLILMGIVVNNGIVLVDRINQLVNQGFNVHDAIIEASITRVKPILMTVATTVVGLLPLALGNTQIGGDGPPYSPMAIAIIGGLIFSTITSLFLVPLTYLLLLRLRRFYANLFARSEQVTQRITRFS